MAGTSVTSYASQALSAQQMEEERRRKAIEEGRATSTATGALGGHAVTDAMTATANAPAGGQQLSDEAARLRGLGEIGWRAGQTDAANNALAQDPRYQTQQMQKQLLDQYNNPQTRPAPDIQRTTIQSTQPAAAGNPGPAAQVQIPTVGPAPTIAGVPQVTAGTVRAPTIGPIERVTAPELAPTAQATAATVARGDSDQIRQRQLQLIDALNASATGTGGPSAAELLGKQQAEEAISTQKSLVAGAHGTGRVGAILRAQDNISSIQTKAAQNAAILRAQEQQQARGQLLQGLEGTRGADIGLATTEAGFQQQTNLANVNAENVRSLKEGDLRLAAAQGNQAAYNELQRRQAELTLAADTTTAQLGVQAQEANQRSATTINVAQAQIQSDIQKLEAQIKLQGGIANAEQQNEMAKLTAQLQTTTNIANLQEQGATNRAQGQISSNESIQQVDADLRARGLDDAQRANVLNNLTTVNGQLLQAKSDEERNAILRQQAADAKSAGEKQFWLGLVGTIIGAGATVGAAAVGKPPVPTSDRRAKTDIKPLYSDERGKTAKAVLASLGAKGPVEDLLEKLHPSTFRYKDPGAEGAAPGKRYGVMAQDLEKSPMGASIVIDDGGTKKIDAAQAVGVLLAAMSRMNQRVKKVEGLRR